MTPPDPTLQRLSLLVGPEAVDRARRLRAILFGLGGVGSWCAEALVRSGVRRLALVDPDEIGPTNVNRQLHATPSAVGQPKVEEMRRRLLEIRPDAEIEAIRRTFDAQSAGDFDLASYDAVIDAIDSLSPKVELIVRASEAGARVYTALGASGKLDPTRIRTGSLWASTHCRLGHFVRKKLHRRGFAGEVSAVWSDEPAKPRAEDEFNGSAVHVTGAFGFALAGLVLRDAFRLDPPETAR